VTGYIHARDVVFSPPDIGRRRRNGDDLALPDTPRSTPLEWARRRRNDRVDRRRNAARDKTIGRLGRLGEGWHFLDTAALGLGAHDAFVAIGPGGLFGVTVKSQGRSRVLLSGDTVQINGRRPDYVGETRRVAQAISATFSRAAGGIKVPVVPVLALAGSGPITVYGAPRGIVVMPYRELDNLLRGYGDRISAKTVAKLASIARQPVTSVDRRNAELVSSHTWHSGKAPADKSPSGR